MTLVRVDAENMDPAVIERAAAIVRRGGLVAFPTETVYGLGADATNATAVESIFAAKGRPSYNPLIVHAHDAAAARRCVATWPEIADALARRFWPGPLTVVLERSKSIPDIVTAGLETVGVRVPAHPVALALLRAANLPLAAPSANRSTGVSPTSGEHVASSLGDRVELILDAGPTTVGIESTVLDISSPVPAILRPGMVSRAQLEAVIGTVLEASAHELTTGPRPSPGMMDRHYSPAARVVITDGVTATTDAARRESADGGKVVVMSRSPVTPGPYTLWPMPDDPAAYATALYATLHRVDREGYRIVVIEAVPDTGEWAALRDRIRRSAT